MEEDDEADYEDIQKLEFELEKRKKEEKKLSKSKNTRKLFFHKRHHDRRSTTLPPYDLPPDIPVRNAHGPHVKYVPRMSDEGSGSFESQDQRVNRILAGKIATKEELTQVENRLLTGILDLVTGGGGRGLAGMIPKLGLRQGQLANRINPLYGAIQHMYKFYPEAPTNSPTTETTTVTSTSSTTTTTAYISTTTEEVTTTPQTSSEEDEGSDEESAGSGATQPLSLLAAFGQVPKKVYIATGTGTLATVIGIVLVR